MSHDGRESRVSARFRVGRSASLAAAHVEVLLDRLDQATDASERARLLLDVGVALRDDLGDTRQAYDAFVEAWRFDPTLEVLEGLERAVREEGRWTEILELTATLATGERDHARALAYAEVLVRWLSRDVPSPEHARHWIEHIRKRDATHWQVHLYDAAIARDRGDLRREIDLLDRAVLSARGSDDRARIHLLMAARYLDARTLNVAEAKKHFAAAHKLYPRTMEPLLGLEAVAVREDDRIALADVLRRQADAEIGVAARIDVLFRLASLEESEFKKPDLAARTLQRIVAVDATQEAAWEGLERCYLAGRAWGDLAGVLERGVFAATDAASRGSHLRRLGEVLESKLGDARAAYVTYERLSSSWPDDEVILEELARLAEKLGDIGRAVAVRDRQAALAADPGVRARMNILAGQLLLATDGAAARVRFERAVEADPAAKGAWNALLWDARAESDDPRTLRYLEERAAKTELPRARATAFVELAEAHGKRGDEASAHLAWEAAIAADPTHEVAASALVASRVAAGRFAEADALLAVARAAADRDKNPSAQFPLRRAETAIATGLGQPERALAAALAAYELSPSILEGRSALVAAAFAVAADPCVLTAKDALIAIGARPEGLTIDARADLAQILLLSGAGEIAARLFESVLAVDADHLRALRGLAAHFAASGNPVAALSLKRQMARAIPDPDERYELLVEVGDGLVEKIGSGALAGDVLPPLAVEVYEEALSLRPGALPVLHKLLPLYQRLERWSSVFEALRAIVAVDVDPVRQAKTLFTMAQIARDQLADRGAALTLFERALDVDPSRLDAFDRISRMLTEERDWLGLAHMYGRMISRAQSQSDLPLLHALTSQLAVLYRDRLHDPVRAVEALQLATRIKPDDEHAQTMLRELLASTGHEQGAVAVTVERIVQKPLDPAPYAALFDLLVRQGERDRALVVASAMRFLGIDHPPASGFRAAYPQPPLEAIMLGLGQGGYRRLLHPEIDPSLSLIFEIVAPAVLEVLAARQSFFDRRAQPGAALKDDHWVSRMVAKVAGVLGVPRPRVFQAKEPGPAFVVAKTRPPSLVVHVPALGGIARDVLTFVVAKRLMELSPPLLARTLCPSITELKALAASSARIVTGGTDPADAPLQAQLKKDDLARIREAVEDATRRSGTFDVLRWSQLADLSAARGALLLAGDLDAARAALAIEAQLPGDLSPREKMKELVVFYLGDECARLRSTIGVTLR